MDIIYYSLLLIIIIITHHYYFGVWFDYRLAVSPSLSYNVIIVVIMMMKTMTAINY